MKRKNIIQTLFGAGMLVSLGTFGLMQTTLSASANTTFSQGNWEYTINSNDTVIVSGYTGSSTSVTVPTSVTYDGKTYTIRTVGEGCFEGNTSLRIATIPSQITTLENCAFKNCTFLSEIIINGDLYDCSDRSTSSYSYIYSYDEYSVFYNAGANADTLTVTFGDGVTEIPAYLFATGGSESDGVHCHITTVNIPDSVTKIGKCAFKRCYDLTSVSTGNGVTEIGAYCFEYDTAIESLTLGKKVSTIGTYAFHGCTGLESLTLPSTVQTLENCAFKNCTFLSEIVINGDLYDCSDRSASSSYDGYSAFYNAGANANTLTVTFGDGVTEIPAYLFATGGEKSDGVHCHITTVNIPDSVTKIGECAFNRCYDLTGVSTGDGVTEIGAYCFEYDTAIESLTLGKKVSTIGTYAFHGCTSLESLTLPSTVQTLENCAFKNCTFLSEIVINGDLYDCSDRSASSSSYGGYSVFYNAGANADALTVTFGDGVTEIPAYLFATGGEKSDETYCRVTTVSIPVSVTKIGTYAFYHCYDLETIYFGGTEERWEYLLNISDLGLENSVSLSYGNASAVVTADLDGDTEITISDAALCLQAYANAAAGNDDGLTDDQRKAADIDGDGVITINDASYILQYYANNAAGNAVTWADILP